MIKESRIKSISKTIVGLVNRTKFDVNKGVQISEDDVFRIVNAAIIANKFKISNSFLKNDKNNYVYRFELENKLNECEKAFKFIYGNKFNEENWYLINCLKFTAKVTYNKNTKVVEIFTTEKPTKLFMTLLNLLKLKYTRYAKLTD